MEGNDSSKRDKILLAVVIGCVATLIICTAALLIYNHQLEKSKKALEKVKEIAENASKYASGSDEQEHVEGFADDISYSDYMDSLEDNGNTPDYSTVLPRGLQKLNEMNPDCVAWLTVDGTVIDYPVMHTPMDNEYYLHRNFYKEYDKEGLPFIDYRCNTKLPSSNIIIYAHNMKNGDMFASLLNYREKDFFKDHNRIRLTTLDTSMEFEIVSVFRSRFYEKGEEGFRFYDYIEARSASVAQDFINGLNASGLYDTGAVLEPTDIFITLVTCEYTQEDGRFVVVGRLIKERNENEND